MIYDRTQTDVEDAIRLRKEKVQKFQELTEAEILTLEKGMLTINTLNRIEAKQEELKRLFNDIGYWNTSITNKSWSESNIFNVEEFRRLINNTNVLRDAFFVYKNTPNTPPISYHWKDINALEKILYDLDIMIDDVKNSYRECGNLQCGETN